MNVVSLPFVLCLCCYSAGIYLLVCSETREAGRGEVPGLWCPTWSSLRSAAHYIRHMKRLDQGHLHSKLEVPGLTCHGRESNPGLRPVGRRAL
jgi:hypothetical protein